MNSFLFFFKWNGTLNFCPQLFVPHVKEKKNSNIFPCQ